MKKSKFPSRILLATGYPWANGVGPYYEITMRKGPKSSLNEALRFPKALWSENVPKYRLVLERVDK